MADIRGLLQSRISAFDPTLDVSLGSPVDKFIIEPVVKALASDPIATDTREFLVQKFKEGFPQYSLTDGDAISDILINALSLFMEAYRVELNQLKKSQSILNFDQMTNAQMDGLAANWLVTRRAGSRAFGSVRLTVNRLAPISINRSVIFTSTTGKVFIPSLEYTITTSNLMSNPAGVGRYFVDIEVVANADGSDGNLLPGQITSVSGIQGVVSVNNLSTTIGGADGDTNESLSASRIRTSISERSLVTKRGISAKLDSFLNTVRRYQIVGFGDPEMSRDAVSIAGIGSAISIGVAYFNESICIINTVGQSRFPVVGEYVTDQLSSSSYEITAILSTSDSSIFMNDGKTCVVRIDRSDDYQPYCTYVVLSQRMSVNLASETFTDTAHIGGRTDIYLGTTDDRQVSTDIQAYVENYLYKGYKILSSTLSVMVLDKHVEGVDDMYLVILTDNFKFCSKIYSYLNSSDISDTEICTELPLPSAVNGYINWYIVDKLVVPITETYIQIYPIDTTTISLFYTEDPKIYRTSLDLSYTDVRSQDYIKIDAEGVLIEQSISSISPFAITLSSPIDIPPEGIKFVIIRYKRSVPSPTTFIDKVSIGDTEIPYGLSLGAKTYCMGGSKLTHEGVGFVSGSLHYALKKHFVNTDNDFLPSTKRITSSELLENSLLKQPSDRLDDATRLDGVSAISFVDSADDGKSTDIVIPNEMLVPGTDNIFICMGNPSSSSLDDDFPINASDGDILEILDGINAGSYVIQSVFNIKIPLTSNPVQSAGESLFSTGLEIGFYSTHIR
jgi:hypothetical protein